MIFILQPRKKGNAGSQGRYLLVIKVKLEYKNLNHRLSLVIKGSKKINSPVW